ncbi:MAG: hypothetical protein IPK13_10255 [Deltaproteobacteria bacterium]|nr:hypothetical protein [Deltaproteobacteria bacterium]
MAKTNESQSTSAETRKTQAELSAGSALSSALAYLESHPAKPLITSGLGKKLENLSVRESIKKKQR